jgi:transposase InsO family protein
MNDSRIDSIAQLRAFVKGSIKFEITLETIEAKYQLIRQTLAKFNYAKLARHDKHVIRLYLKKLTGYKKAQLNRLIKRAGEGKLERTIYVRQQPHRVYTPADIKLLETTDALHRRLNRLATKAILKREAELFGHTDFTHLSQISPSHIDNLRKTSHYREFWVNGTQPRDIGIGTTKAPEPNACPGSIRVDTVHQRDVYYLNAVCEITQWEVVVCVPLISERYLLPALRRMLNQFPFTIFNFHSDRGSEFINHTVARLLNKLLIEQTKSRSKHSNDNALVESKNGAVIRKNMGYTHINFLAAEDISDFMEQWFNPYLNYHRPCLFVTQVKIDHKGRETKVYGQATTPYEKLKEISKGQHKDFLKPGLSFATLDTFAYQESDNQFALKMRQQETALFSKIAKMKG